MARPSRNATYRYRRNTGQHSGGLLIQRVTEENPSFSTRTFEEGRAVQECVNVNAVHGGEHVAQNVHCAVVLAAENLADPSFPFLEVHRKRQSQLAQARNTPSQELDCHMFGIQVDEAFLQDIAAHQPDKLTNEHRRILVSQGKCTPRRIAPTPP